MQMDMDARCLYRQATRFKNNVTYFLAKGIAEVGILYQLFEKAHLIVIKFPSGRVICEAKFFNNK